MASEQSPQFTIPNAASLVGRRVQQTVSQMMNTLPSQVDLPSLRMFLQAADRQPRDEFRRSALYAEFINQGEMDLIARPSHEQEVIQAAEALYAEFGSRFSFGMGIPSWLPRLERFRDRTQNDNPQILLVGALTLASAEEYVATARHIFQKPTLYIIDPKPTTAGEIQGEAHFLQADFLTEPYEAGSMDIIVADFLLSNLQSKNGTPYSPEEGIALFFIAAFNALKEGGQLILTEHSLLRLLGMGLISAGHDRDSGEFKEATRVYLHTLESFLRLAGFSNVEITPYVKVKRQVLTGKIMLGNNWDLNQDETTTLGSAICISAIK